MWEFFIGVSAACFFAVYLLKKGSHPPLGQREAVYAPRDEVVQYRTRKKSGDFAAAPDYSFNPAAPAAEEAPVPARTIDRDAFVEYTTKIAEESPPKELNSTPSDAENEDDEEKKSKFSALRFFDS